MEDVFKTLNLSDDNEIFRGYTTMIELYIYNAFKFSFLTMLFMIENTLRFNLGVAILKSVSMIYVSGESVIFLHE